MKSFLDRLPRHRLPNVVTIEGGRVPCPIRGNADIEECWICPAYRGSGDDTLSCAGRAVAMPLHASGAHL